MFDESGAPSTQECWRAIILFGRNVASYKFALGKTLLSMHGQAGQLVKLEDLALPFSRHICEHLLLENKQATSSSSAFLDACRSYNRGELDDDKLAAAAVAQGFNNVIDAFHVVGSADTPHRFFIDERMSTGGIRLTQEFGTLAEAADLADLGSEVEARWRLVESAWSLGVHYSVVGYDAEQEMLYMPDRASRRKSVTGVRAALNGYQQGACFYCGGPVCLHEEGLLPDVDHFFPHVLKLRNAGFDGTLDGVWNLVLACRTCNRGAKGKFERLPSERLMAMLHHRNEYLIRSHHPLREALIRQTGGDEGARRAFLWSAHKRALQVLIHRWEPSEPIRPLEQQAGRP